MSANSDLSSINQRVQDPIQKTESSESMFQQYNWEQKYQQIISVH